MYDHYISNDEGKEQIIFEIIFIFKIFYKGNRTKNEKKNASIIMLM